MNQYISKIKYLFASLFLTAVACQDELPEFDYTVEGEDVELTVPLSLPKMDVQSRANMPENDLNRVESLWIATFNSNTGKMTTDGWIDVTDELPNTDKLPTTDKEVPHKVTLETKSGSSYIVAVANVDNMAIDKDKPTEEKKLSELLMAADTWEKFLNIAVVSPSTRNLINAPLSPLPMCGAYTNLVAGGDHNTLPHRFDDWQTENFKAYTIPASENGTMTMTDGAIHLRRLVSQITFNVRPDNDNIRITPTSYQVVNVPKYSWLYERSAKDGMLANFGDVNTDESKSGDYYVSPEAFTNFGQVAAEGERKAGYTFNFWQGENKHTAPGCADYNARELEEKNDDNENTGIYTSLSGSNWTPNNMASLVVINCEVEYNAQISVDGEGATDRPDSNKPVWRSGNATYVIHLGYMNEDPTDFNCFRNTRYTYEVAVQGLNQIRVEAWGGDPTNGAEGIVSDVENQSMALDAHYAAYNIKLSDEDLATWNSETGKGFGFILTTYDNNTGSPEKTYQETDFVSYASYDDVPASIKKYINWVELRPTSGEKVLAEYKPRGNNGSGSSDGRTFNLIDAAKGHRYVTAAKAAAGSVTGSDSGEKWYTVFVNEYTYECDGANETGVDASGRHHWQAYVNANPRRYYLRVTRSVSTDGQSIYARSKYSGSQESITTYYATDQQTVASGSGQVDGSIIGVERINESFGLNLRRSFTNSSNEVNGRINLLQFIRSRYNNNGSWTTGSTNRTWNYYLNPTQPQEIGAFYEDNNGKTGYHEAQTVYLPKIYNFRGDASYDQYSPQQNSNASSYIEAIAACMNRNRDNNGNGTIDNDEIRWYVPAKSKYLRMIIGAAGLGEDALMDYSKISSLPYPGSQNGHNGPFLYYCSDGAVLWAMEGYSTSTWGAYGAIPWQVRCIRNLGTNLANVNEVDQTVMAYTYDKATRVVKPTYYSIENKRPYRLSGNGAGTGQMPVHSLSNYEYNSIYREGFEVSERQIGSISNPKSWTSLKTTVESSSNLCNESKEGGKTGWRLPNVTELAVMRNLGLLTSGQFNISCSMVQFNSNGIKVEPSSSTPSGTRYFLFADGSIVTQGWEEKENLYFRCVRDVD